MRSATIPTAASGALFALLASCALEPLSDDPAGTPPGTEPEARTGAEVYAAQCGSCHGPEGEGSALAPQIQSPVVGYATYVARAGRDEMPFEGAMPAFSADALSDQDLGAALEHLRSFPKPTDGAGLYTRYCGNCHGGDAQGGRVGQDLTHEVHEEPDEFVEKVREGEGGTEYGARTEYMPAWSAEELTDGDVGLIVAYLQTLPLGPGEEEEEEEGEEEE